MDDVSTMRLYVLRAGYLLIAVGLGAEIWPQVFDHTPEWGIRHGVGTSLLAALSAVGVRHPLRMLPILLFELTWKTIWMLSVALPVQQAGLMDQATRENVFACGLGVVIFPFVIPWRYVFANLVSGAGDRWR